MLYRTENKIMTKVVHNKVIQGFEILSLLQKI